MYRLRQRRASRVVFSLADAFGYVGTGLGQSRARVIAMVWMARLSWRSP